MNRGCCLHEKCWSRKDKFKKLYEEGNEKMNELFDLSKILKDLRMATIFLEHSFVSDKIKKRIDHTELNLIDLESEISESPSDGHLDSDENEHQFFKKEPID